jgi:hypothetical protein
VGRLLHLHRPGHVVVSIVEKHLVVRLHGRLAGDDDFSLVEVLQAAEQVRVGVSFGPPVALTVALPRGKVTAEVFPESLIALHLLGVGGVEVTGVGHAVGEGASGVLDVSDFHGVKGVSGRGNNAVVDEMVLGVDVEVLAEGVLAGSQEALELRKPAGPGRLALPELLSSCLYVALYP